MKIFILTLLLLYTINCKHQASEFTICKYTNDCMVYGNKCCEVTLGSLSYNICTNTTLTSHNYVPVYAATFHGWKINKKSCMYAPWIPLSAVKIVTAASSMIFACI